MQVKDYAQGKNYIVYNADCVEVARNLDDNSVGFIVYSPPFSSLYTYSNDERDMGNCKNDDEFFMHFGFLIKEMYRILQPGRLMAVHCMNLPRTCQPVSRTTALSVSKIFEATLSAHFRQKDLFTTQKFASGKIQW